MQEDVALIGNERILGRVRRNGVLEDVFFPSKGFHRHIMRSQFGVYLPQRREMTWLSESWSGECGYLEDTFVSEGIFRHPSGLEVRLLDGVPVDEDVFLRLVTVRNLRDYPQELSLLHAEAAALEENEHEFGRNAAYVNRQKRILRYRGHPFDNTREAHVALLIEGSPEPEEYQVGHSYAEHGQDVDAFHDAADGRLQGNSLCAGNGAGATSALLWKLKLPPGGSARVCVVLAGGTDTRDAEERLRTLEGRAPEELLDRAARWWRDWIKRADPLLRQIPTSRLRRLARRSLLVLKLLQHQDGAFLAAPNLYPDYRYCWPRDAAYMAWMLSRYGYRTEAERFFRWCADTQCASGMWHQNYYTDGRPHWTAVQVDQTGSVLWALAEHLRMHPSPTLATELWPMVRAAAGALERERDGLNGLISSPQCLWEECGGTFTYTNAASAAGLQAAAYVAGRAGMAAAGSGFLHSSEDLMAAIRAILVQDGKLVAELHPQRPHGARDRYEQDISVLGLAVPYTLVPPEWEPLAHHAAHFCQSFHWPAGGLGRYPGDRFEGGNPWPLCSLWMAAYHLHAGQAESAMEHLEWALEQVTPLGHFPEQVHQQSGHLVSALPLGWAHAWYLWILSDFYIKRPAALPGRAAAPVLAR